MQSSITRATVCRRASGWWWHLHRRSAHQPATQAPLQHPRAVHTVTLCTVTPPTSLAATHTARRYINPAGACRPLGSFCTNGHRTWSSQALIAPVDIAAGAAGEDGQAMGLLLEMAGSMQEVCWLLQPHVAQHCAGLAASEVYHAISALRKHKPRSAATAAPQAHPTASMGDGGTNSDEQIAQEALAALFNRAQAVGGDFTPHQLLGLVDTGLAFGYRNTPQVASLWAELSQHLESAWPTIGPAEGLGLLYTAMRIEGPSSPAVDRILQQLQTRVHNLDERCLSRLVTLCKAPGVPVDASLVQEMASRAAVLAPTMPTSSLVGLASLVARSGTECNLPQPLIQRLSKATPQLRTNGVLILAGICAGSETLRQGLWSAVSTRAIELVPTLDAQTLGSLAGAAQFEQPTSALWLALQQRADQLLQEGHVVDLPAPSPLPTGTKAEVVGSVESNTAGELATRTHDASVHEVAAAPVGAAQPTSVPRAQKILLGLQARWARGRPGPAEVSAAMGLVDTVLGHACTATQPHVDARLDGAIRSVLQAAARGASRADTDGLVQAARVMATTGLLHYGREGVAPHLAPVLAACVGRLGKMQPGHAVEVAYAAARAGVHREETAHILSLLAGKDRLQRLADLPGPVLARAWYSYQALLPGLPRPRQQQLGRMATQHAPGLDLASITVAMEAWALHRSALDPQLMAPLPQRAAMLVPAASFPDLCRLMVAAGSGPLPQPICGELATSVRQAVATQAASFTPDQAADITWGLARTGHLDPPTLLSLGDRGIAQPGALTPGGLVHFLEACRVARMHHGPLLATLAAVARQHAPDLDIAQTQRVARSVWQLGLAAQHPEVGMALSGRIEVIVATGQGKARDRANLSDLNAHLQAPTVGVLDLVDVHGGEWASSQPATSRVTSSGPAYPTDVLSPAGVAPAVAATLEAQAAWAEQQVGGLARAEEPLPSPPTTTAAPTAAPPAAPAPSMLSPDLAVPATPPLAKHLSVHMAHGGPTTSKQVMAAFVAVGNWWRTAGCPAVEGKDRQALKRLVRTALPQVKHYGRAETITAAGVLGRLGRVLGTEALVRELASRAAAISRQLTVDEVAGVASSLALCGAHSEPLGTAVARAVAKVGPQQLGPATTVHVLHSVAWHGHGPEVAGDTLDRLLAGALPHVGTLGHDHCGRLLAALGHGAPWLGGSNLVPHLVQRATDLAPTAPPGFVVRAAEALACSHTGSPAAYEALEARGLALAGSVSLAELARLVGALGQVGHSTPDLLGALNERVAAGGSVGAADVVAVLGAYAVHKDIPPTALATITARLTQEYVERFAARTLYTVLLSLAQLAEAGTTIDKRVVKVLRARARALHPHLAGPNQQRLQQAVTMLVRAMAPPPTSAPRSIPVLDSPTPATIECEGQQALVRAYGHLKDVKGLLPAELHEALQAAKAVGLPTPTKAWSNQYRQLVGHLVQQVPIASPQLTGPEAADIVSSLGLLGAELKKQVAGAMPAALGRCLGVAHSLGAGHLAEVLLALDSTGAPTHHHSSVLDLQARVLCLPHESISVAAAAAIAHAAVNMNTANPLLLDLCDRKLRKAGHELDEIGMEHALVGFFRAPNYNARPLLDALSPRLFTLLTTCQPRLIAAAAFALGAARYRHKPISMLVANRAAKFVTTMSARDLSYVAMGVVQTHAATPELMIAIGNESAKQSRHMGRSDVRRLLTAFITAGLPHPVLLGAIANELPGLSRVFTASNIVGVARAYTLLDPEGRLLGAEGLNALRKRAAQIGQEMSEEERVNLVKCLEELGRRVVG